LFIEVEDSFVIVAYSFSGSYIIGCGWSGAVRSLGCVRHFGLQQTKETAKIHRSLYSEHAQLASGKLLQFSLQVDCPTFMCIVVPLCVD
jgi:hypothetical protein